MSYRHLILVSIFFVVQVGPVAAQQTSGAAVGWSVPRTSAGHPDLQGIWANDSATPLERPDGFAEKAVLTDEEFATLKERAAELTSASSDAGFLDEVFRAEANDAVEFESLCAGTGNYNNFWLTERYFENRTSLIVDPPDGRIPYTSEARQEMEEQLAGFFSSEPVASWEELGLLTRCVTNGLPNLLPGYNTNYQILQTSDYVMILQELMHEARVIPLNGGAHIDSNIRQWLGDSRGHWEGQTLVITTKNFNSKTSIRGSSEHVRLVERYTRVGPNTMHYEFMVDDVTRFTRSWAAMIPLQKIEGPIFEYACHEGNYGLVGILAGARADDAAAQAGGR